LDGRWLLCAHNRIELALMLSLLGR